MPKTKKPVETKREMEERHVERLACAYHDVFVTLHKDAARRDYALIRAAVYAVVPGKQKNKNIAGLMELAVKAAARRIRTNRGK